MEMNGQDIKGIERQLLHMEEKEITGNKWKWKKWKEIKEPTRKETTWRKWQEMKGNQWK